MVFGLDRTLWFHGAPKDLVPINTKTPLRVLVLQQDPSGQQHGWGAVMGSGCYWCPPQVLDQASGPELQLLWALGTAKAKGELMFSPSWGITPGKLGCSISLLHGPQGLKDTRVQVAGQGNKKSSFQHETNSVILFMLQSSLGMRLTADSKWNPFWLSTTPALSSSLTLSPVGSPSINHKYPKPSLKLSF